MKKYNVMINEVDGRYLAKGGKNVTLEKAKEVVKDWLGLDENWETTYYDNKIGYDKDATEWTSIFGGQIYIVEIK